MTRKLPALLAFALFACAVYCSSGALSPMAAYAAPTPPPAAAPAAQPASPASPAPAAAKPVPKQITVPEPEKEHKGFPWMLVGIAIALVIGVAGYYKSKG